MAKKVFITGGAGFIPSHLEDLFISKGYEVAVADVLDRRDCQNISHLFDKDNFTYHKIDVANTEKMLVLTKGFDEIYHFAANANILKGSNDPNIDYHNNLETTHSILECMRRNGIRDLFFASTSAVYGNMEGDLAEDAGPLNPLSYYGASKLASEALISSYAHMNDLRALVFRFPNIVGPRLTHGVIYDFICKLKRNPKRLQILGDGKQSKQYLYVEDLVNGIDLFAGNMEEGYNVYNVSTTTSTNVDTIADLVCERMGLDDVQYEYSGGPVGWKGDVRSFAYNIEKARRHGWTFRYESTEAVRVALENIDLDSVNP